MIKSVLSSSTFDHKTVFREIRLMFDFTASSRFMTSHDRYMKIPACCTTTSFSIQPWLLPLWVSSTTTSSFLLEFKAVKRDAGEIDSTRDSVNSCCGDYWSSLRVIVPRFVIKLCKSNDLISFGIFMWVSHHLKRESSSVFQRIGRFAIAAIF